MHDTRPTRIQSWTNGIAVALHCRAKGLVVPCLSLFPLVLPGFVPTLALPFPANDYAMLQASVQRLRPPVESRNKAVKHVSSVGLFPDPARRARRPC